MFGDIKQCSAIKKNKLVEFSEQSLLLHLINDDAIVFGL